jgi:hypothetical protein
MSRLDRRLRIAFRRARDQSQPIVATGSRQRWITAAPIKDLLNRIAPAAD